MARLLVLAGLAVLTVAEVAAVLGLVDWLGPGPALLVLGLDMVVGLTVIRWAARGPVPGRGWRLAAGAFIALPGLVLDLVGLLLLVPAVQRWMSGRVTAGTESLLRRQGMHVVTVTDATGAARTTVVPGDVIRGDVVDDSGSVQTQSPTDDPAGGTSRGGSGSTGPGVIRGELAGPDDPPAS